MIRRTSVDELRTRAGDLVVEAAAATGLVADVQWQWLLDLEDAGALICLVLEVDGALEGYLVACCGPEFWNTSSSCQTLSLYVRKAFRWRWGKALIRRAVEIAGQRGVATFRIGVLPRSRLHRLATALAFEEQAVYLEVQPTAWLRH